MSGGSVRDPNFGGAWEEYMYVYTFILSPLVSRINSCWTLTSWF